MFNKVILSHSYIGEHRAPFGALFPHVEINNGAAGNIFVGQYREAAIFKTQQRTFEFTNNFQYFAGKHRLTLGTHNEYYGIKYHFVTPWNGRWAYSSIDNFFADKPNRIRRTFNLKDNSYPQNYDKPAADYGVLLGSAYVQDELAIFESRLSISLGMRLDASIFPTKPAANAAVLQNEAFAGYDQQLNNKYALSPRFGFNSKLDARERLVLRGGSGVFVGRMPFAWLTYPFLYDGNRYGNIDYRPAGKVVGLKSSVEELIALQGGFQQEINLLDPSLRLPRVWRNNIAFDINLGKGWALGLEGIYTKTLFDTKFETLNLKPNSVPLSSWDARPYFSGEKVDTDYTSVFAVTNTKKGHRYSFSTNLRKTAKNWGFSGAYSYGLSKDLANGVRVSPQANWEWNQTLDPNNPRASYSNFDLRHRVIASADLNLHWKQNLPVSFALVYIASSGQPFSYIYNGDVNRDGSPTNDLIYVPQNFEESGLVDLKNSTGQVIRTASEQWADLDEYLKNDPYLSSRRGKYVERNGARAPWNQQLDLRILQQLILKNGHRLQLSLDFINVSNWFSKIWGRQYFVPNTTNAGYALLSFLKVENSKPQYRFDKPAAAPYQFDPIASRMQGQIGLKYIF
jgi:hypothetical protein